MFNQISKNSFLNELEKTAISSLVPKLAKSVGSFFKGSTGRKVMAGTNAAGFASSVMGKNPMPPVPNFALRTSGFTGAAPANLSVLNPASRF